MILRLTLAPPLALGLLASLPVAAQAQPDKAAACANSAAIVMQAVEGRKQGVAKSQARAALREQIGDRGAGDMLADWIWSLPEDQLTDEVGTAWEAQCLAQ